jgi:hypothetical protein
MTIPTAMDYAPDIAFGDLLQGSTVIKATADRRRLLQGPVAGFRRQTSPCFTATVSNCLTRTYINASHATSFGSNFPDRLLSFFFFFICLLCLISDRRQAQLLIISGLDFHYSS